MDTPPAPPRLSLQEALRRYWKHLIGIAILPSVALTGFRYHVPFPVMVILFLAAALHAGWPYLRGRAPYSFWIVACGVWMAGAVVGLALLAAINAITPR